MCSYRVAVLWLAVHLACACAGLALGLGSSPLPGAAAENFRAFGRGCMNCHSQLWTNAKILAPIRDSYRTNTPAKWRRVNALPDFVYFDHSIHVNKGVGCATCHGPVDRMPLMYAASSLQMEWCLNCHRAPEKYLRPRGEVFNMRYEPPTAGHAVTVDGKPFTDQASLGMYLVKRYHLRNAYEIASWNTCHR